MCFWRNALVFVLIGVLHPVLWGEYFLKSFGGVQLVMADHQLGTFLISLDSYDRNVVFLVRFK